MEPSLFPHSPAAAIARRLSSPGLQPVQRQVKQKGIHIIPHRAARSRAAEDLVAASRHTNDRRIKGTTAEIIHHDQFAAGAGSRTQA